MQDARYDELTASQRKALFHVEGPLLVLAGPGSGKTRVITCRIAALIDSGVRPYNICAITFTNRAAEEMRQRAASYGAAGGAHISTFHSLCVRVLRKYAGAMAATGSPIRSNFSIYDDSDQGRCVRGAVKQCELDTKNFSPGRCLAAISALKNRLVDADAFAAEADDFFSKALAKIYRRYQSILNANNALDFDDLLMETALLLENNPQVRGELNNRFRFLLVDEYQDTNHAQYRIARALASEHNNICVTGDPDQSIYRWRGADIGNILAFEKDWPDAAVVKLEENFRSTPNILNLADKLIAFNKQRKEKRLVATRQAGEDVSVNVLEDEEEEAAAVARQIKELREQGSSLNGIAVFYRTNAMSRSLEEAFIREKIPYQVVRGVEFYNRKEIRDMLAYLKVLANTSDEVSLLRIINTPARGIGKTTIERIRSYAAAQGISFHAALGRVGQIDSLGNGPKAKVAVFVEMLNQFRQDVEGPVAPLARRIFVESGIQRYLESRDVKEESALENIDALINAAAEYDERSEEPSLVDYLQEISLFSDTDSYDASGERVALMTLHAAKGLEFENVFIIGLEDGILPHERSASSSEELEEERRLFFVGITRAKDCLWISYSRYRTFHGQFLRTIQSPFLYEIGVEVRNAAEDEDDDAGFEDTGWAVPKFIVGELVGHKSFGLGRVREYVDIGEDSVVVVKFNTGQTKTLMVKYAKLLKMQKP